jgi:methylglyoxal/glyoxal reductase
MKITSIADRVALHNGVEMPWFGLGVFRAQEGDEVFNAVCHAAACSYRSIDTAAVYGNEEGVGRALRACGVPREEMFVTTKVWNSDQGYDTTLQAFDASLGRLGLDTVDLYLVHWPVTGQFTETWRALERMYAEGRARAIGVSNFLEHHLDTLLQRAEVVPMVNQVEFHPRLVQPGLLAKCDALGIRLEAWSPIMRGKVDEIPELQEIAARHGKSPAQVTLRWDLQHGVVTIPKSVRPERIASNADVFDFELAPEEMAAIDALDRNERLGPDPDTF